MFNITNHISTAKSHPIRTGVFAVSAVLVSGIVAGFVFGFSAPSLTHADIIVTAPVPLPVLPPPVIVPPVIIPIIPITPVVVPPGHTNPGTTNDDDSDDDEIVVTGNPDEDTDGPPCCTLPGSTPPTIDVDIDGPSCCTLPGSTPPTIDVDIDGPSCCTVPEIPYVPPTTPVVPIVPIIPDEPPPPVVTPEARCILVSVTPNEIRAGDAVTIAWQFDESDNISIDAIDPNTPGNQAPRLIHITTSTSEAGSVIVHPTQTTTYVGSVSNGTGSVNCQGTVRVTSRPQEVVPMCVQLTSDRQTVGKDGGDVVLSWVTSNADSISIDNGVGSVTPVASGSKVVHVDRETTFTATVPNEAAKPACQVTVKLESDNPGCTSGCGGGGGGGGGKSRPRVVLDSVTRAAEAPLGSVYLSEIPYTGLDLGPVGTAIYWTMLIVWSLAAAYLVLFGGLPVLRRKLASFGGQVRDSLNSEPAHNPYVAHAMPAGSVVAQYAPAPTPHTAIYAAAVTASMPVAERTAPAPRMEMTGTGFKAFASNGALTIDDIVKGLSRESGMQFSAEPTHVEAPVAAAPAPEPAYEAPARVAAPKQEANVVHPEITTFISHILEGERDAVFATIRHLNQAGHDVEEFVSHAILALDDAYKARIDGTPVHEDVKQVTDHCATSFLERLVTSLTTAVDGSYSMGVTGIKLALTRALSVAQG